MILALDPSFSSTGLTSIDPVQRVITINKFSAEIGEKRGFDNVLRASHRLAGEIVRFMNNNSINPTHFVQEIASPLGMFSSGLWVLDATLIDTMWKIPVLKQAFMFNTNYLTFLHHKRYKKMESKKLAMSLLQTFLDNGYTLNVRKAYKKLTPSVITHDEAESFLFATRLYARLHNDIPLGDVTERILIEKEVLVYER